LDEGLRAAERSWWRWWPVTIGALAIGLVYLAHAAGCGWCIAKRPHEALAIVLVCAAILAHGARAFRDRSPAHLLLALLAVAFLCREIHWRWTHKGVYVMAGLIFLWGIIWHRRVWQRLRVGSFWPWLCATGWTYVLANLVARRVFRGILPREQALHVALEEVLENTAHLMLFVTAFADRFGGSSAARAGGAEADA
jgi:hypothetical protein